MRIWAVIICFLSLLMTSPLLLAQAINNTSNNTSANTKRDSSVSEFQQWLASNGYLDNTRQETVAASTTSTGGALYQSPPTTTVNSDRRKHVHIGHRELPPLTYERSKEIMRNTAPSTPQPTDDQVLAFNALLQQNMPLKPQQVVELRQQIDAAQRAAVIPPVVPPKPVSSTLMINLAPGSTPPVIRLATGYVTSMVFVDSTGSPWPIAAFDIGNPKNVNIQWDGKSNILLMQSVSPYGHGDIVFRLVGLPTPITLELISGQRVVDFRVDIHVPGIGPNAKDIPIGTALPNSANQLLLGVLDGVAPAGSRVLNVRGVDSQAWLLGERMYLRTRFTVLSPGWISTMVSIDGMHAYELPKTSSVLISRYGEPYEIKVEGF